MSESESASPSTSLSTSMSAGTVASARTPGFDVARAGAILAMILVNYAAMADLTEGPPLADWLIAQLEGKAAALFVTLAGIGVSLRVRSAQRKGLTMGYEQRALVRRALVLFMCGLVHRHYWEWDILHMYGVFVLCAALVLRASSPVLLLLAGALIAGTVPLQNRFDYDQLTDFWTLRGALTEIGFNGLFPVFPWLSFLLVGMVLGRLELDERRTRVRLALGCLPALGLLVALDHWSTVVTEGPPPYPPLWQWVSTWPRPPTPGFALIGSVCAVLLVCLAIELTMGREREPWVLALTATGQLALSVYLAHGVAITIAVEHHEWFTEGSMLPVLAYGLVFYLAALWFAWRWRLRWHYGPFELIVRQLSAGSPAAPWGGAPLSTTLRKQLR